MSFVHVGPSERAKARRDRITYALWCLMAPLSRPDRETIEQMTIACASTGTACWSFWIGAKQYLTLPLVRMAAGPYELAEGRWLRIGSDFRFGASVRFDPAPALSGSLRFVVELGGILYRRYA